MPEQKTIHIGRIIEAELHRQGRTVTWFAKNIYCNRANAYNIFSRPSLDTDLLLRISRVLNVNFFKYYTDEIG